MSAVNRLTGQRMMNKPEYTPCLFYIPCDPNGNRVWPSEKSYVQNYFYNYTWYRVDKKGVFKLYNGKGTGIRALVHRRHCSNKRLKSAIDCHGQQSFTIIITGYSKSEELVFEKEVEQINRHRRLKNCVVYNSTDGGGGIAGYVHSDESIAKMRIVQTLPEVRTKKVMCLRSKNDRQLRDPNSSPLDPVIWAAKCSRMNRWYICVEGLSVSTQKVSSYLPGASTIGSRLFLSLMRQGKRPQNKMSESFYRQFDSPEEHKKAADLVWSLIKQGDLHEARLHIPVYCRRVLNHLENVESKTFASREEAKEYLEANGYKGAW